MLPVWLKRNHAVFSLLDIDFTVLHCLPPEGGVPEELLTTMTRDSTVSREATDGSPSDSMRLHTNR